MSGEYSPGELFVYENGDRLELGMVKSPNRTGDGYFCWYSLGDTAANTPTRCMRKLANAGFTRIDREMEMRSNIIIAQSEVMCSMAAMFVLGAESGEGLSRQWCRELADKFKAAMESFAKDAEEK